MEERDMVCVGSTIDEFCGGNDKISAYKIENIDLEYIDGYADNSDVQAMSMEGKYISEDMTNKV